MGPIAPQHPIQYPEQKHEAHNQYVLDKWFMVDSLGFGS